jgi:membrane-associated phospholipid phosphatase
MPTIGIFFILNSGTHFALLPFEIKRLVYIIVFTSTFLLPVSLLPLFLQIKLIKSFEMETARERIYPALTSSAFFLLAYFLLNRLNVSVLIETFLLSSLVAILISVAISFFWKISLHALAVGGVSGLIIAMMFKYGSDLLPLLSVMIIISGLVAMARLFLNAHSPAQIYAGYFLGLIIVGSGIMLL